MGKFNEELVKAGVMLAGEGLHASSKGARVRFEGSKRTVIDGPFAESKELVAGYWLWQVRSKEEAIEWLRRAPFQEGEVEIRQVFETAEFGASDPTGELAKGKTSCGRWSSRATANRASLDPVRGSEDRWACQRYRSSKPGWRERGKAEKKPGALSLDRMP
jgi:hypothetical protein